MPDALTSYSEQAATRSEHLQLLLRHLDYRKWQLQDSPGLAAPALCQGRRADQYW